MESLRTYLTSRSWLIAAVVLAALCLRVLTPQGYMPVIEQERIEVLVCHGAGNAPATVQLDIPAGTTSDGAAERCAFAELAVPLLGSIDPIQLTLAIAFVLALWLANSSTVPLRATPHLRPPSRGPPAAA
jgi:hypothetical protein